MMGRSGQSLPATNTGSAANNTNVNPSSLTANAGDLLKAKNNSTMGFVIALLGFVALYIIWALVAKHERVRKALEPANLEINLYNLFVIWFVVILTVPFSKVLVTKMVGWGIPGAKWLLGVVGNA